jgi:hypothetical protein
MTPKYIDSGVLAKKYCNAFILVMKTDTNMGYMEKADILDMARQNFCQAPIATTGRYDPFTYTTPPSVFSTLSTSMISLVTGSLSPTGAGENVSINI